MSAQGRSSLRRNISLKRKLKLSTKSYIYSLAEELLAKESIGLPDIIRILGDRPFPMKESLREYLTELMERKVKEDAIPVATEEPAEEKKEDVAEALSTEIPAVPVEEQPKEKKE